LQQANGKRKKTHEEEHEKVMKRGEANKRKKGRKQWK